MATNSTTRHKRLKINHSLETSSLPQSVKSVIEVAYDYNNFDLDRNNIPLKCKG